MSSDRRYSLLRHDHDSIYPGSADTETITGSWTFSNALNGKSLILSAPDTQITIYETDAADPTDRAWFHLHGNRLLLQTYDASAAVSRTVLTANVTGGGVALNTGTGGNSTSIGNSTAGSVVNLYGGQAAVAYLVSPDSASCYATQFCDGGATTTGYWYTAESAHGFLGKDGSWDLTIYQSTNQIEIYGDLLVPSGKVIYINGSTGTQYIGDNTASTYSPLRVGGSKGGYGGFYDVYSSINCMFESGHNGGFYNEAASKWMLYYNYGNDCWGMGATTTSSSYRLYVTGSALATGSWATSDIRKKENIKTLDAALDRVCALRGVNYTWRADADVGQDSTILHLGVIAQEVQETVPEAVHYAADADSYAVDYNGLVGLLIQAVKELREEVNELKKERRR